MFGPDQMALMIPLLIFAIPIIAILTGHQQKMAQIMREQNQGAVDHTQLEMLRRELAELKQIVHQQSIAIDNLANASARVTPMEDQLQDRIG